MAVKPLNDNSFGTSTCLAIEIVGHIDISEVYSSVFEQTDSLDYNAVERNPDDYKYVSAITSGTVFQIIEEGSNSCEYLIDTLDGKVYVTWYSNKDAGGPRFLEGDSVKIYGDLYGLKTYSTLAGKNSVPFIEAAVMLMN